jgi:PKD repeat protein
MPVQRVLLWALCCLLCAAGPAAAGELVAWGSNYLGQCDVPAAAQSGIIAVAAGEYHSLALTAAGEVLAWGDNKQGQCDVPAAAQSGIIAIAAGGHHNLALTAAGEVIGWGVAAHGAATPPPGAQSGVIAIAAGYAHSMALTAAGEVLAWGDNAVGTCDVPVAAQSGIIAIAAGMHYSMALTNAGQVIVWGDYQVGEYDVPVAAQSGIIAIDAGRDVGLALTDAGEVIAWGYNGNGACDVPVAAQSGIIAIATGANYGLALTESGEVLAWGGGDNYYGQCDVPVAAQSGIIAIDAGAQTYHSLALRVETTAPVADFSGTPTTGSIPLTAYFANLSAGDLTSWEWDFGDGGTSTQRNPSHTYTGVGSYTVSLTATSIFGSDTETKSDYVTVCFVDVGEGHWAASEVDACASAGIVSGYPDGSYQPGAAVTRDQMAVYVSRALAGGDENVPDFTDTPTFPDVDGTHWALDYVEYAVDQNVVAGYEDGNYHPERQVTRDQMAVYVARALVAPEGEAGLADYVPADPRDFPDVASGFWAYTHVEYCVEHGVVAGYLDNLYHPEIVVTRDQMAVYVARAFGLTP